MDKVQIDFLDIEENQDYSEIIDRALTKCYEEEDIEKKNLYIQITLTNPENIREINKQYRNIDKATDVLSFPMFEREEIKNIDGKYKDILGDIVISIKQVQAQAEEYGHSFERELSYMVVHGFYHLLGYDHIEEEDKKEMRVKEEVILSKLHLSEL